MPVYIEPYDLAHSPARPIVKELTLSEVDGPWITTITALVDSGADRSMVPVSVVQPVLDLSPTHVETLIGVGQFPIQATSVRLQCHINGLTIEHDLIYIIAFGTLPLIGRDILNQVKTVLDGPPLDGPFPKLTMYSA